MNIVSLNVSDLGGLSYNLCDAINRLTPHHAVNVVMTRTFTLKTVMLNLKRQIYLGKEKEFRKQLRREVKNADVLHVNEKWYCINGFRIDPKKCRDKTVIYHAHGSAFRRQSGNILRNFRSVFPHLRVITGTPDLVSYAPGSSWFPSIVPIKQLRKSYPRRRNRIPVIYYSPTGSSSVVMRRVIDNVARDLRSDGLEFDLQVTTKTLHSLNMRRKAKADIYYDEIAPSPFYGINAIEAGAFEMSVVCDMNRFAKSYLLANGVTCPFPLASDESTLKYLLKRLIMDKPHRDKLGRAAYKYVRKMHSEKVCVKRFLELIESQEQRASIPQLEPPKNLAKSARGVRLFQFYNEVGAKYPHSGVVYKGGAARIREGAIRALLSKGDRFTDAVTKRNSLTLDMGCGDGHYKRFILNFVGLDASLSRLKRFKGRRTWAVVEHVPFADEVFDRILLSEVLEHTWKRKQILDECYRVLKTGGHLILSAPFGKNPYCIKGDWSHLQKFGIEYCPYVHGHFSEAYTRQLLENSRFFVRKLETLFTRTRIQGAQGKAVVRPRFVIAVADKR